MARSQALLVLVPLAAAPAGAAAATLRRIRRGAADGPAPAEAIVVFGAQARNGRPSAELRARLAHAADLHAQGWAPLVVCSGGPAEADAMAAWLRERLPAGSVATDPAGVSTRATVAGLRGRGRLLLVSSPYHAHRIRAEARRRGLDARVCAAPDCPIEAAPPALRRQRLRELVATWWYALRPA